MTGKLRYQGQTPVTLPFYSAFMVAALGITPLGFRKDGSPIWPIGGGDENADIGRQIEALTGEIAKLRDARVEANPAGKAADGGRYAAALDGSKEIADKLTALSEQVAEMKTAKDQTAARQQIEEVVKAVLRDTRSPSMAGMIGQGQLTDSVNRRIDSVIPAHPALKASFRDYVSGEIVSAIMAQSVDQFDPDNFARGKAQLQALGLVHLGVPESSKATLGATGATGGYVLPNNLVASLEKPNTQAAVYTASGDPLLTVIPGVAVRGVDQPFRTGAPSRMTFQDWGTTKENVNEAYGSYTAVLGTLARIYDVGKQYLRFSAGAAEVDVMDELTKAAALAENYYVIAGAGTGTVGSGDPTTGVYTGLIASGAYTTNNAAASNSTIAGSAAASLATAFGTMAARNQQPSAVVVDATTYWTMFRQGNDNAGFYMSELLGAGFQIGPDNTLRWRGVPILYDANLGTNAATKIAIAADWKRAKFFRGIEFRIDSSDVAGDRWDKNLVGFRGEEEIGFNAYTAIAIGAFQLITNFIP